jgi:hypothetical protein
MVFIAALAMLMEVWFFKNKKKIATLANRAKRNESE